MPDINTNGAVTCPDCRGTGDVGGNPSYGPCERCNRTGKIAPQPMPDINKTDLAELIDEILTEDAPNKYVWKTFFTQEEWIRDKLLPAIRSAKTTIEAQAAEISRLRDALKPFVALLNASEASAKSHGRSPDETSDQQAALQFANVGAITIGDFRRARTALEANHG